MSALLDLDDQPVTLTRFGSTRSTQGSRETASWQSVCQAVVQPQTFEDAKALPLVSFGTYPNDSRAAGSQPETITAVAGDYDGEEMSFDEAVSLLSKAGLASAVHTTKRHTPATPRWRVIAPLKCPISADQYWGLVARLDALLGRVLAPESYQATRCYFFGAVRDTEYRAMQTAGQCLDELETSQGAPSLVQGGTTLPGRGSQAANDDDFDRQLAIERCTDETMDELESALECISSDDRQNWIAIGHALACLKGTWHEDRARDLWIEWSMQSENFKEGDEAQWDSFRTSRSTYRTVFALARQAGWRNPRSKARVVDAPVAVDPVALDWSTLPEDPPDVNFVIPGWMPDGAVTLFAAHGGVGKSFMSIYVALCLATGRHPFVEGQAIPRVRVLLYSAEDNMRVMQRRIVSYVRKLAIDPTELSEWLHVLDATSSDNVLFKSDQHAQGWTTPRFDWLSREIARFGADVLIFDNASDAIDANENDRAKVRQFASSLRRLAPAVLLLAHVDALSSMADPSAAKGYSGSTAWHNSARSRWFMARVKDSDDVCLSLPKMNYARAGSEVVIRWSADHAVFEVVSTRSGRAKTEDYRHTLLRLLQVAVEELGMDVSPASNTSKSVYNMIKGMDEFPSGLTTSGVATEVRRWQSQGLVEVEPYRCANRSTGRRLVLTDRGRNACSRVSPEAVFQ